MKYLLKRIRFLDKYNDDSSRVYIKAVKSYFKHLLKLDLANNLSLLKYFGYDFFHDATISSINFDVIKRKITLSIIRAEADREDINHFLETIGLKPISNTDFIKNPVRYECEFYNTDGLNGMLSYNIPSEITIMDSEIEYLKKDKCFKLTISTDSRAEFWFTFTRSEVKILSKSIIRRYTAGRMSDVPYCEQCRLRILTKQILQNFIRRGKFV
jgi:hypothetical protein